MARILVIDDDKDIVEIVRFTMAQDGHEVIEAKNGKEGLDRVSASKPDLIILDVMMPEMDGLTLNAILSASPETKAIPVLVLTSKNRMREVFVSSSNVQSYMDKPFEPSALQEQIRQILKTRPK